MAQVSQQREGARKRDVQADDTKKKRGPEEESAPIPEGAAKDPGAALVSFGAGTGERLLGVMQEAGGNLAVNEELVGLGEGQSAANQAASDKAAFDAMSGPQRYAHMVALKGEGFAQGGGGGGGGEEGGESAPPPGFDDPSGVVAFHAQRGAEVQSLADSAAQAAAEFTALSSSGALDPAALEVLQQTADYYNNLNVEALSLKAQYDMVAAEMATNEFAAMAIPPEKMAEIYAERSSTLDQQATALQEAAMAMNEEITAAQAAVTQLDAQIQAMMAEIAALNEQMAASGGDAGGEEGGAPAAAPAGGGADIGAQLAKKSAQLDKLKADKAAKSQQIVQAETFKAGISRSIGVVKATVTAYGVLGGGAPPVPDLAAAGAG